MRQQATLERTPASFRNRLSHSVDAGVAVPPRVVCHWNDISFLQWFPILHIEDDSLCFCCFHLQRAIELGGIGHLPPMRRARNTNRHTPPMVLVVNALQKGHFKPAVMTIQQQEWRTRIPSVKDIVTVNVREAVSKCLTCHTGFG